MKDELNPEQIPAPGAALCAVVVGASAGGGQALAAILSLLTGASNDGTQGLRTVKASGGATLVQDPATAPYPVMPRSAVDAGVADQVMPLEGIGRLLTKLSR